MKGETEYKFVMSVVAPFMDDNHMGLYELVDSADQIRFVSNETELAFPVINLLVLADKMKRDIEGDTLFHELFYGAGRQGTHLDWIRISLQNEEQLLYAIKRSIGENINATFK